MAQLDGTPPPTRPSPPAAAPAPERARRPRRARRRRHGARRRRRARRRRAAAAPEGSATEAELRRQLAALSRRCEAAEAAVRSKEASLREHEGTRTALLDALDESRARLSEMAEELAEARTLRAAEARSPRSSSPALASLLGCVGGREEKLGAGGGGASAGRRSR